MKVVSRYEFWVVFTTECWKCGKPIKVATGNRQWSEKTDRRIEKVLESFGVKRELRYSKTINRVYIANVCPYCNAIQGDWFLHFEPDVVKKDKKYIIFRNGEVNDIFSSYKKFKEKYWKLLSLRRCEICGCYIDEDQSFEKFVDEHPEVREVLGEALCFRRKAVEHHIDYEKDITIFICTDCHAKIHHSNDQEYAKFRPR
jgi:DNA-directed RNA polymerase subunit N (RpoN/RPB10)